MSWTEKENVYYPRQSYCEGPGRCRCRDEYVDALRRRYNGVRIWYHHDRSPEVNCSKECCSDESKPEKQLNVNDIAHMSMDSEMSWSNQEECYTAVGHRQDEPGAQCDDSWSDDDVVKPPPVYASTPTKHQYREGATVQASVSSMVLFDDEPMEQDHWGQSLASRDELDDYDVQEITEHNRAVCYETDVIPTEISPDDSYDEELDVRMSTSELREALKLDPEVVRRLEMITFTEATEEMPSSDNESLTDNGNCKMSTAELREFLKLDADVIRRLDMMCTSQSTDGVQQPESSNSWGLLTRTTQQSHPAMVQYQ